MNVNPADFTDYDPREGEATAIQTVLNMGLESLDPETCIKLEDAIAELIATRQLERYL